MISHTIKVQETTATVKKEMIEKICREKFYTHVKFLYTCNKSLFYSAVHVLEQDDKIKN